MESQEQISKPVDWGAWLREYGPRLLLFARQQSRSGEDAEDIMQEALVRLVQKHNEGSFVGDQAQWLPYVYTSIRRIAMDYARSEDCRAGREQVLYHDTTAEQDSNIWFQSDQDHDVLCSHVNDQLKMLPKKFSEVIVLKIWGEQSFQQIASELGIPLSTVASRYRYGMSQLREGFMQSNPLEI